MIGRRLRDLVVIETTTPLEQGTNEYGDEDDTLPDAWTAVEVSALVVPVDSTEDEVDRATVARRFELFLPASATIDATARVRITVDENVELVCRVVGEPIIWRTATRRVSHKVARLEAVAG